MLDDEYGLYFKVARSFAKIIGQPTLMRELTRVGMRSQSLMEWVLRIMAKSGCCGSWRTCSGTTRSAPRRRPTGRLPGSPAWCRTRHPCDPAGPGTRVTPPARRQVTNTPGDTSTGNGSPRDNRPSPSTRPASANRPSMRRSTVTDGAFGSTTQYHGKPASS
jgi:hypothetical protein